jgi:replicative DNA helicase
VIDLIKKKYDITNVVPTGFDIFDRKVFPFGGFERSRLYLFGGGSGSGKSTLMTNFIEKGLLSKSGQKGVYVYITLENLVDETLTRMYQSMFGIDTQKFVNEDVVLGADYIKKCIMARSENQECNVVFKYFPKFSISPADIMMVLDDVISEYGQDSILGLIIDYLDLIKLDLVKYDAYRLELSHITSNLKDIAVIYNIPVISPTQLGREVYMKNMTAKDLNLGLISEAIKKVEHADFVALMVKDQQQEGVVHMFIGKNRGGPVNIALKALVEFDKFKFKNIIYETNDDTAKEYTNTREDKNIMVIDENSNYQKKEIPESVIKNSY